ncbi:MAG: ABC transporter permease [Thermodesulfobacterium sp.]|nr:ABC transporter permease [Thermodesulfobacterium sp.]
MKTSFFQFLKDIFKELFSNKVNFFFMFLALTISLITLNTIYSLGLSAKKQVMDSLASVQFGKDAMLIIAGGGRIVGLTTTRRDTLKLEDVEEIKKLDFVKLASPISIGTLEVSYKGIAEKLRVEGVLPVYVLANNWYPKVGRFINEKDLKTKAKVCLVGADIPKKFNIKNILGVKIKIAGQYFKVIGVLESKPFFGHHRWGERILIPLTTAQRRVFNKDYIEGVKLLFREGTDIKMAEKKIRKILRKRHKLSELEPDDFRIITPELAISVFTRTMRTINIFLLAIALISLTISGVIIMNLMYANIEEKAPIIALRIALGADPGKIVKHYLVMSFFIAIISGAIGWVLSIFLTQIVSFFTPLKPIFSGKVFILSLSFATFTSVTFTLMPAIRASKIEPAILLKTL